MIGKHGYPSRAAALLFVIVLLPMTAVAGSAQTVRTQIVTPEARYDAGWLTRFFLGDLHRDLWALPVEAEVLDLSRHGGGLTPERRGGGLQTTSLRFQGADGQTYTFRSIDKDATRNLDPLMQRSVAAALLQDQIGALFPVSAMVVAQLLDATGLLHADPKLVVMPDDPALGSFREDFAGLLGWIEVRPDEGPDGEPGFAGSTRVTGSKRFRDHLEEGPHHRVNAEAYLRARLMDLFVGDWDRHPDQWRWAAFEEDGRTRWEPIPRDRDWALSHIDGFFIGYGRALFPHYVGFSDRYESVFGTTWNGRALDRELLSELSRVEWEAVAANLQSLLTDDVIAAAVATLPNSYAERLGPELEAALLARRDDLGSAAMRYYGILSGWVDIYGTDQDEFALVERLEGGATRVRMFSTPDENSGPAFFDRTFDPAETREVRLFLRGGSDHLLVRGAAEAKISVRAIGGGSGDTLEDQTTGQRVAFYDDRGTNTFLPSGKTLVDESHYEEPNDTESETHQARPRDWGSRWTSLKLIGANSDVGFFIGETATRKSYGFRHFPHQTILTITGTVNPINFGVAGQVTYEFPVKRGRLFSGFEVAGSTREVRQFFGVGNETVKAGSTSFFSADRAHVSLEVPLKLRLGTDLEFRIGPAVGFSTPVDEDRTFLEAEGPRYGFEDFGWVGLNGGFLWDTRDTPALPRKGGLLQAQGRFVPEALDVEDTYGFVSGSASISVPLGWPVVSAKVAGTKVWGDYPYFDGAILGGPNSLRGFDLQRFVGDASILGSSQIRAPLGEVVLLMPLEIGVHAIYEVGRVFLDEDVGADDWHTAYGGGLWISVMKPEYTFGITVIDAEERTALYLSLGLGF